MIGSTRAIRVFARMRPTDLRKGFDGLYGLVRSEFKQDPLAGDLFLFLNRRRTSAKVLHWDGTGLCIYAKRLAKNRFTNLWKMGSADAPITLTQAELTLILQGADLVGKLPISPKEYE